MNDELNPRALADYNRARFAAFSTVTTDSTAPSCPCRMIQLLEHIVVHRYFGVSTGNVTIPMKKYHTLV